MISHYISLYNVHLYIQIYLYTYAKNIYTYIYIYTFIHIYITNIYTHMYGARPSQSLSIGSAHNAVTAKLRDFLPFFVVAAAE